MQVERKLIKHLRKWISYPAPGFVINLGRENPPARPWEMLCGASFLAKTGGSSTWSLAYALSPPSPSVLRPRSQLTGKIIQSAKAGDQWFTGINEVLLSLHTLSRSHLLWGLVWLYLVTIKWPHESSKEVYIPWSVKGLFSTNEKAAAMQCNVCGSCRKQ